MHFIASRISTKIFKNISLNNPKQIYIYIINENCHRDNEEHPTKSRKLNLKYAEYKL